MQSEHLTQPTGHIEDRVIAALRLTYWDAKITGWLAMNGIMLLRIALGIIFFWFGALKYFPGVSSAETIASDTITTLTGGHLKPSVSMPILATWECAIGLGLLTCRLPRLTILLLLGQMCGTVLPFFFYPARSWEHFPYAPTLLRQYIVKNLILIAGGMLVGATARGGRVVADPNAALIAKDIEARQNSRFRCLFKKEPYPVSPE